MKKLLALLLLFPLYAFGAIVNPTQTPILAINCTAPTEYTDNSPILERWMIHRLYRGTSPTGSFEVVSVWGACNFFVDTTILTDGTKYYYYATTISPLLGRESDPSAMIEIEIRRDVIPQSPAMCTI